MITVKVLANKATVSHKRSRINLMQFTMSLYATTTPYNDFVYVFSAFA